MQEIIISASELRTADNFYDAFLAAAGAPSWHGHNLNALWDSIVTGNINQIEPPYRVMITGVDQTSAECRQMIDRFVSLIREASENGTPVEAHVQP